MNNALAIDTRPTLRLVTNSPSDSPSDSPSQAITEVSKDFTDYLVVERNASGHTVRAYNQDLQDLVEFLGDTDVDAISMGDLRAFLKSLYEKGHSAATIGRKLSTLRSFFVFTCREGLTEINHARALRAPKIRERLPHFLSEVEIETLLEAPESPRDRAILETLYSTGLRISELVGLNVADIDLATKTVKVTGKGNRERLAPLGQYAIDALEKYINGRINGAVFLNYKNNRLGVDGIRGMLAKYLKKVGLDPTTTPHSIRHSYATHMLDNGADIRMVQEMLGHKSITSTQIYTHVSKGRQQVAHQQFHPRG